ncbi:MAG: hypothetical protein QW814_01310 [Methanothrix sp.]
MEIEKEKVTIEQKPISTSTDNKNSGIVDVGAEKSKEKAIIYLNKAIVYRQNFVLARLIDANDSIKFALEVFKPGDTIGMIPNGTTGPLIDMLKQATSNIERIYSTITSEAFTQYKDSLELSQKSFLISEDSMINTSQAENIIKFRKNQKKNVRKPKKSADLDGQMTPSEYTKSALTRAERKGAVRNIKKKLDEDQKRLRSEISSTQKAINKFGSSEEMAEFTGIKSLLEDKEFLYHTISLTIAQNGIATKVINPDNLEKLSNVLSVYKMANAKEKENETFPHAGLMEKDQLIKGYLENLKKLELMLRKQ